MKADRRHSPVSILAVAMHVVEVVRRDEAIGAALDACPPSVFENVTARWSPLNRTVSVTLVMDGAELARHGLEIDRDTGRLR